MKLFLSGKSGAITKEVAPLIEFIIHNRLISFADIYKTNRVQPEEIYSMKLFLSGKNGKVDSDYNMIGSPINHYPSFNNRLLSYEFILKKVQEDPRMFLYLSSSRGKSVGEALSLINDSDLKLNRLYSYIKEAKERMDIMKIFMGGVFPYDKEDHEKAIENRLTSYHFQNNGKGQFSPEVLFEMRENRGSIMVDSGAFSVWTKGKIIDLNEYIEWIKENLAFADYFVSLDVIPGTPSKPAVSLIEKEESARRSLQNYHRMVRAGIPPEKLIHVLHFGDDIKWADKCKNLPFIGFGGLVGQNPESRAIWLQNMAAELVDSQGYPINKWHLFGVTDQTTLLTLPMYSADSAGWLRKAVIGSIDLWDNEKITAIRICDQINDKTGHFTDLPPVLREKIEQQIVEYGFTLEQLQDKNASARIGFNIQTWRKYEQWINEQRSYPWPMQLKKTHVLF